MFVLPKTDLKPDWSFVPNLERNLKKEFKLDKDISIALVSQAEIQKLNKTYRGKDVPTDVLTFNLDDEEDKQLGEIVICWPILKKQAKENGNTMLDELKLLTVHGVLHLMGYEHDTKKKREQMSKLEQKLLSQI